jgi:hypothetical protein
VRRGVDYRAVIFQGGRVFAIFKTAEDDGIVSEPAFATAKVLSVILNIS